MMKKQLLGVVLGVSVSACATLEPEECKTADWTKLGYTDAMKGSSVMLGDYGKDCAKAGVTPDQKAYMSGYNSGTKAFCTYKKGVEVGKNGSYVSNLCNKPGLAENFNRGLAKGKQLRAKQQEISDKKSERDAIKQKLQAVKDGKVQSSSQEVDMLYRQKELLDKEIALLKREKSMLIK